MPHDLGPASKSDLTGHFPGEDADSVVPMAEFLESSGRLEPADEIQPASSDASSGDTEGIEALKRDTEPSPLLAPEPLDNGHDTDVLVPDPVPQALEPSLATPNALQPVSDDTGMLELDREDTVRDPDLALLPEDKDDDTSLKNDDEGEEKITAKVHPPVESLNRQPDPLLRDTVNFFNQTQNFSTARGGGINPTQSISVDPDESRGGTTIRPISPQNLPVESSIEDADRRDTDKFNEDDRRPPTPPQPTGSEPELSAESTNGELEAIADESLASGKDTQKFFVADLAPKAADDTDSSLANTVELRAFNRDQVVSSPVIEDDPLPEAETPRVADSPLLEPSAPVAASNDSDIELTAEPDLESLESIDQESVGSSTEPDMIETSDQSTEVSPAPSNEPTPTNAETTEPPTRTVSRPVIPKATRPLPAPEDVEDFEPPRATASQAIAPEYEASNVTPLEPINESEPNDAGETVLVQPNDDERPTGNVSPRPGQEHTTRRSKIRRITDNLTRRIEEERQETVALLRDAENLVRRLSEASHIELPEPSPTPIAHTTNGNGHHDDSHHDLPVFDSSEPEPIHDHDKPEPEPPEPEFSDDTASDGPFDAPPVPRTDVSEVLGRLNHRLDSGRRALDDLLSRSRRLESAPAPTPSPMMPTAAAASVAVAERDPNDEIRQELHALREELRQSQRVATAPEPPPEVAPNPNESRLLQEIEEIKDELRRSQRNAQTVPRIEIGTRKIDSEPESGSKGSETDDWLYDAQWKMLVGIGLVAFALGLIFVWILLAGLR